MLLCRLEAGASVDRGMVSGLGRGGLGREPGHCLMRSLHLSSRLQPEVAAISVVNFGDRHFAKSELMKIDPGIRKMEISIH